MQTSEQLAQSKTNLLQSSGFALPLLAKIGFCRLSLVGVRGNIGVVVQRQDHHSAAALCSERESVTRSSFASQNAGEVS